MAVLFMSIIAAVVLAALARTKGDGNAAEKPAAEGVLPRNAVLAATTFGLLIGMLLVAEAMHRFVGPDSWLTQLDGILQERTSYLISRVTEVHASSIAASNTAVMHQAVLAATLCVFAVMQRNRWR